VARSPTELIRELTTEVEILRERDLNRRGEIEELKESLRREIEERRAADSRHRDLIDGSARIWPRFIRRMPSFARSSRTMSLSTRRRIAVDRP
jgi:hypothetical protein